MKINPLFSNITNYAARCIPVANSTFCFDFLFFLPDGWDVGLVAKRAASIASLRTRARGADTSSSLDGGGGGGAAVLRTRHVPLVLAI